MGQLTGWWGTDSTGEPATNGDAADTSNDARAQSNGGNTPEPVSGPPSRIPSLAPPSSSDPPSDNQEAVQADAAVPMPGALEGANGGSDVLRDTRTAQLASLAEQADIRCVLILSCHDDF